MAGLSTHSLIEHAHTFTRWLPLRLPSDRGGNRNVSALAYAQVSHAFTIGLEPGLEPKSFGSKSHVCEDKALLFLMYKNVHSCVYVYL